MHIPAVMLSAFLTISAAESSVFSERALAAASAYGPPDPIATMLSSGSMISPLPGRTRSRARKTGEDRVVLHFPDFFCLDFHDRIPECDLAVASQRNFVFADHSQY